MKILYVVTLGTWGGAQKHVYELIKDQIERQHQVTLLTGKNGKLTQMVQSEFPQVNIIFQQSLKRELSPKDDLTAVKELRKTIKEENPDIVHLHSSKAGTIGRIASIGLNVPVIFTIHGWSFENTNFSNTKRKLFENLERLLSRFTTKYICVSDYSDQLGKKMKIYFRKNQSVVIPNGITNKKIDHVDNDDVVRLVMAARFSKQKNQKLLIKAISKVRSNVELDLLGDGPTINTCKSLVKDLNLNNKVRFYGSVDDVNQFYKKADIAILISNYEALPLSMIEALRAGLPIIASNVGGNAQLVSAGNGIIVNNDADEIATKIDKLSENPCLRKVMGKDSRNLFLSEFTKERMLKETNRVYLNIIND